MQTYISLLRGINVSGQKKIKMADLKLLFESLKLEEVKTYIQSGNVIFKTSTTDKNEVQLLVQNKIKEEYNFDVIVFIVTPEDIISILDKNPYKGEEITKQYFSFLDKIPQKELIEQFNELDKKGDLIKVDEKMIYTCYASRYSDSKFNNNLYEKKLKVNTTTRNFNTLNKLVELS